MIPVIKSSNDEQHSFFVMCMSPLPKIKHLWYMLEPRSSLYSIDISMYLLYWQSTLNLVATLFPLRVASTFMIQGPDMIKFMVAL
jgi:hypothetical protein